MPPSPAAGPARPLETADAVADQGTPRDDPHGLIGGTLPRRLIAAAYRREREAPEKVARLGAAIDVCLFASPVPYEYARRAGVISVPSTYVRLDGGALYAALLRASRSPGYDIERVSVDVLARSSVDEAYAEVGLVRRRRPAAPGPRQPRRAGGLPRAALAHGRDVGRSHLPRFGEPPADQGRGPGA